MRRCSRRKFFLFIFRLRATKDALNKAVRGARKIIVFCKKRHKRVEKRGKNDATSPQLEVKFHVMTKVVLALLPQNIWDSLITTRCERY